MMQGLELDIVNCLRGGGQRSTKAIMIAVSEARLSRARLAWWYRPLSAVIGEKTLEVILAPSVYAIDVALIELRKSYVVVSTTLSGSDSLVWRLRIT